MKIRWLIFAVMQLPLAFFLSAQETREPLIEYAVQAGLNLQGMIGKDAEGDKLGYSRINGLRLGFSIHLPVKQDLSVRGGLFIAQKGAENGTVSPRNIYKIYYLEVPLFATYKRPAGTGWFEFGAGPYAGYGLKGKTIIKGSNESLETDIEFKKIVQPEEPYSLNYFRRFDAGAGVFAGYKWPSGIFMQISGNLGILKINPEDQRIVDDQTAIRNVGMGVLLGIVF